MTKEELSNMACEAYNSLGMNPPHYHWMDGFVAGYVANQQKLKQCNVSGSLPSLDDETTVTPIQDALYATGRFSTDDCSNLADGILQYIKDAKMSIVGGNDR